MRCIPGAAVLLTATLAGLAGCSDQPQKRRETELARFEAYAGAPVDKITWIGRYDHWTPLSRTQLIVWTTPWDAYLVRVADPCADLPYVNGISFRTSTDYTLRVRFDSLLVKGWVCPLQEIRPVDYRRMQADDARARGTAPPPAAGAAH